MAAQYPPYNPGIPNRTLPPYVQHGPGFNPVFNGSHTFGTSTNPMLNLLFARNNYRHYDLTRFADNQFMQNNGPNMNYYNNAIFPGVSRASQIFKDALGLNPQGGPGGGGYGPGTSQGSDGFSFGNLLSKTAIGTGLGAIAGGLIGGPPGAILGAKIGAAGGAVIGGVFSGAKKILGGIF